MHQVHTHGYDKSYKELLAESGMSFLKERLEKAVITFPPKNAKYTVYANWFKPNPNPTSERNPMVYMEEFARTSCFYNSPLF